MLSIEIEEVQELDRGIVEMEEEDPFAVEVDGGGEAEPAPRLTTLALKVRVMNGYETLKLRVGPARFRLATPDGRAFGPMPSVSREPPLRERYLGGNSSMSGWLMFQVPKDEKKLILQSDLQRPPLEVPVPAAAAPE